MPPPISILVVDDSAFMRKMVTEMLSEDPALCVIGQARDGEDALHKIVLLRPDVVTLDIEMPVMDGLATLDQIMERQPTPTIMLSSLTQAGAEMTMHCLERGAVDFVGKPSGSISLDIRVAAADLKAKIKAAAGVRLSGGPHAARQAAPPSFHSGIEAPRLGAASGRVLKNNPASGIALSNASFPAPPRPQAGEGAWGGRAASLSLLVIGASTGGPRALQTLVPALPAGLRVPLVIVQHMPPGFTASLARRLDAECPFPVREAVAGDTLEPGVALLAPGGRHLLFDALGKVTLSDDPPVHGVRPSVDVTLASLARSFGTRTVAVLLTGMGRDGARGLKMIRDRGGATLAEDESTCVVYGMPKAAVELDAVEHLLPLPEIAGAIERLLTETRRATR